MKYLLLCLSILLFGQMSRIEIIPPQVAQIPSLKEKKLQGFIYPYKTISIKPFYIGKYEVTKQEYNLYLQQKQRKLKEFDESELNEPVVNITFDEAQDVCSFYKGRLPSEEEWIVASSLKLAKTKCYENLQEGSFHPYSITPQAIECMKNEDDELEEDLVGTELLDVVDSYENINGTFGMYGNVWEYVNTQIQHFSHQYVVIKGGSYADPKVLFDNRVENFIQKSVRRVNIGFRCTWDKKESKK